MSIFNETVKTAATATPMGEAEILYMIVAACIMLVVLIFAYAIKGTNTSDPRDGRRLMAELNKDSLDSGYEKLKADLSQPIEFTVSDKETEK